ncbi:DUF4381 domain-containing protein [Marinobacter sp. DUT-1]|uniref:DUF4381 domain-containing protein n=1 Tax=Marinobacter sp. DUT-1 TaxID=3412037 RepID=UPI003D17825B
MNPQDPLSQLRDIHLPATGGFWPPAPGWWILAVLILGALALVVVVLLRHRRRNRWRRQAILALTELEQKAEPTPSWFARLNTLLKQAARECHPESQPQALSGNAWVEFLIATTPAGQTAPRQALEAMVRAAWQPSVQADPDEAIRFARHWLGGQKC